MNEFIEFEIISDNQVELNNKIKNDSKLKKFCFTIANEHRASITNEDATIIVGVIAFTGTIIVPIMNELIQNLLTKTDNFILKFLCNSSTYSYEIKIDISNYTDIEIDKKLEKLREECHKNQKLN